MIVVFKTFSGPSHEFRQGVKIPIGIADVMVAQIAREDQDSAVSSTAAGLPALQHSAGMCVAQIVDSWRMALVGDPLAQP